MRALAAALLLTGCAPAPPPPPPVLDGANPASVHCGSLGGETVLDAAMTGFCRLPSGELVEEWELYRASFGG